MRLLIGAAAALALLLVPRVDGASAADATSSAAATVVWALGDGADGSKPSRRLARFVTRRRPDRVFYLGDVYEHGTAADFRRHYAPLYGRLATRTDPVFGNHEFPTRKRGYNRYWRRARGWKPGRARHRAYVDRSGWQILAYNSEHDAAAEARWLSRRMARHRGSCRVAIAHRARYMVPDTLSSPSEDGQEPVWDVLEDRTAINLVAHSHLYGRLEPIDDVNVIVSGAGGHELREVGEPEREVAASVTGRPIALRLVLRPGVARFAAFDARGRVHDRGTIRCRRR
jgi:hypothetical protein